MYINQQIAHCSHQTKLAFNTNNAHPTPLGSCYMYMHKQMQIYAATVMRPTWWQEKSPTSSQSHWAFLRRCPPMSSVQTGGVGTSPGVPESSQFRDWNSPHLSPYRSKVSTQLRTGDWARTTYHFRTCTCIYVSQYETQYKS